MRRLTDRDRPAIEAFLAARIETSLFPLGNLARHGIAGGHPHAMTFWGAGDPLEGVLGLTDGGIVLPQLPPALARDAASALRGQSVVGIIGESQQVAALREATGLAAAPAQLDRDEGLMALALADLRPPPTDGLTLAPLSAASRNLLLRWRTDAQREAYGAGENAEAQAKSDIDAWLTAGTHRVLLRDQRPVAMTGFNARLPGIVQVGAVWTPPEHRRRGLARAAVALHLAEAQAEGIARAALFTANPFAASAYKALGFRDIGHFTLLLFRDPQEVRRA